jgi:hypothetical protein
MYGDEAKRENEKTKDKKTKRQKAENKTKR